MFGRSELGNIFKGGRHCPVQLSQTKAPARTVGSPAHPEAYSEMKEKLKTTANQAQCDEARSQQATPRDVNCPPCQLPANNPALFVNGTFGQKCARARCVAMG